VSILRVSALSSAATQLRRPVADAPPTAADGTRAAREHPDAVPAPEVGRAIRSRRRTEVAAAAVGSTALAVAMTWPALRDPAHTVPQDLVDPLYFVWQLAWVGHALVTDPLDLWTTNAFSGATDNLAYTDTMLGYAPLFAFGGGLRGALVAYNLLFVAISALAFFGAYLLARVLGARWPGAVVAAAAFAYAPWRLAHDRHLNVLSTGGIALAFALLAYGHGWRLRAADRRDTAAPPARRPPSRRWVLAGWAVACWQLTLGFAVGLPFAWALALVVLVAGLTAVVRQRRRGHRWREACRHAYRRSRPVVRADAVGALAFAVVGALLTIPYLRVVSDFPVAKRTEEMLERYSPPVQGLVTAPPESVWAGLQGGLRSSMDAVQEQALLPGFAVLVLAVVGLGYSAWSVRHRVMLALGAAVTALLCLGTSGPFGGELTYLPLFRHVPGWDALRTPGRLILWVTLCLGLLAAGAVTRWAEDAGRRRAALAAGARRPLARRLAAPGLALSLVLPGALVTLEGASDMRYPRVPAAPVPLASLPQPIMVLPTSQGGDFQVMTWSTDGWPRLANGGSGFEPPAQAALRRDLRRFPDTRSLATLRARGVRTVVLVPERAVGTWWERVAERSTARLPVTVRDVRGPDGETALVYTLTPDRRAYR
jgi:hypothetical protein